MTTLNPVEEYIREKYGGLLGIYEDTAVANHNINPAGTAMNKTDYYSIRTFSSGYIIYCKNPILGNDFDNGVPRIPFDQGIKYQGDVRLITHVRYLPIYPDNKLGMGYITIFEPNKVQIFRITADPDKNGIEKFIFFPRPEGLTDAAIHQIRAFSWLRDDVRFHFN